MGRKKDDKTKDQTEDKEELKPMVSVLPDFMLNFMNLPKDIQRKVADFFRKFSNSPTLPGINYETLGGVTDDKVRSVRIDGVYRAIVVTPDKGNVYLLVKVDREDDLYMWVKDLKFSRGKDSNEVIVTRLVEKEESASDRLHVPTEGLLAHCSDDDLKSVGVPPVLLPSVRAMGHEGGYDQLSQYLSSASVMALKFLANELSADEVRKLYSEYGEGTATSGLTPVQATATLQLMDKMREDKKAGRPVNKRAIEAIYKAREDHSQSEFIEKVVRNYPE